MSPPHVCHVPGCYVRVPPKWLMCRRHWGRVPNDLQAAVYDTVRVRGRYVDSSWAAWWRAQAHAIAEAMRADGRDEDDVLSFLNNELATATRLEARR